MTPNEHFNIHRRLIQLLARDSATGQFEALGSGFVVDGGTESVALTAAHVIVDWVNRIDPVKPHPFDGFQPDHESTFKRIRKARDLLTMLITLDPNEGPSLCQVKDVYSSADPTTFDAAFVYFEISDTANQRGIAAFPMDPEEFDLQDPVLLAGYGHGSVKPFRARGESGFRTDQQMFVRAGRITEVASTGDGYKPGIVMYKANIPAEHGMSGGPLLIFRYPTGPRSPIIGAPGRILMTAAGIISKGWFPNEFAGENCTSVTWITPIKILGDFTVKTHSGPMTLRQAATDKKFPTYMSVREDLLAGRPVNAHYG
jgi:hypothetical protein